MEKSFYLKLSTRIFRTYFLSHCFNVKSVNVRHLRIIVKMLLEDCAGSSQKTLKNTCANAEIFDNHSHRKRESFAFYESLNMYVCNCDEITESQVKVALKAGAERWKDVHAHYNCAPQCGKCQCEIIDAISEFQAEEPAYGDRIFAAPNLIRAT